MFAVSGRNMPKLSLSAKGHIESLDAGLTSVQGAKEVIVAIQSRRCVTKLILGHNELGDTGCEALFAFLGSDQGRRYQIQEISLNSNGVGNRGLHAITDYLKDNEVLKELFLQNNTFSSDPDVTHAFALAINSSRLETLSLTTNSQLSDAFLAQFLPALNSLHLANIQLSVLGLTHLSAPHIVEYITSPRCRIHTLHANGNRLGLRAARAIIRAISRSNFTLLKLEMYANGLADVDADASDETADTSEEENSLRGGRATWEDYEKELKRALLRNEHLKKATEREALCLLRYSRGVLLRPRSQEERQRLSDLVFHGDRHAHTPTGLRKDSLLSSIGTPLTLPDPRASSSVLSFASLPIELQLHILSFLAPTLSASQRVRIFTYASSSSTLPQLLPSFPGLRASPPPASMPTGYSANILTPSLGMDMTMRRRRGRALEPSTLTGNNKREQLRADWLARVRCNAFELDHGAPWPEPGVA